MTTIQLLVQQTEKAYVWTHKLMDAVPSENWNIIAEGVGSNMSWQIGHHVISMYYHTMMTTVGHVPELIEKLNLQWYTKQCGYDTFAKDMAVEWEADQLRHDLRYMQKQSLALITSLPEPDLWNPVLTTKVPHPVAKTKFEAIDWNIKHTMWHCGQMATIKRIVDQPYDFGLPKRT
jgi:hypothetical protein